VGNKILILLWKNMANISHKTCLPEKMQVLVSNLIMKRYP
jgi:hypothetical protein